MRIFLLSFFVLHIQPLNAQTYVFHEMSRGFCDNLSDTVYQETRDYYIKHYGPGEYDADIRQHMLMIGLSSCSEQNISRCLESIARTGADGIYATVRCLNKELQSIGLGHLKITERVLIDYGNALPGNDLSCAEQIWMLQRRDWGTARRACGL